MSDEDTSLPLKKVTRDRLRTFGGKGESWDKLLNKLMDELYIRSDGFYLIQFDIGASEFGKIDVLVKNGVPTRAIMDMGSIPEWKRVKLYELVELDDHMNGN
jgi:hypothetical protein